MTVEINIQSCFINFKKSFNRVQYFTNLINTLDASNIPNSWNIEHEKGIVYGVRSLPDQDAQKYIIEACKTYMHSCVVRDCIESFATSLDQLYFILLVDGKIGKGGSLYDLLSEKEKKILRKFEHKGLTNNKNEGKLETLRSTFKIVLPDDFHTLISSLQDIRNCLGSTLTANFMIQWFGKLTKEPSHASFLSFRHSVGSHQATSAA